MQLKKDVIHYNLLMCTQRKFGQKMKMQNSERSTTKRCNILGFGFVGPWAIRHRKDKISTTHKHTHTHTEKRQEPNPIRRTWRLDSLSHYLRRLCRLHLHIQNSCILNEATATASPSPPPMKNVSAFFCIFRNVHSHLCEPSSLS